MKPEDVRLRLLQDPRVLSMKILPDLHPDQITAGATDHPPLLDIGVRRAIVITSPTNSVFLWHLDEMVQQWEISCMNAAEMETLIEDLSRWTTNIPEPETILTKGVFHDCVSMAYSRISDGAKKDSERIECLRLASYMTLRRISQEVHDRDVKIEPKSDCTHIIFTGKAAEVFSGLA